MPPQISNNDLNEKQNSDKFIEYLTAQRQAYTYAKRYFLGSIFFNLIIPIALGLLNIWCSQEHSYCLQYLIILSYLYSIYLENKSQNYINTGASIQQIFDTKLFEIENRYQNYISKDTIIKLNEKSNKNPQKKELLKNWYLPFTNENYQYPFSILKCQQQNLCWTLNSNIQYTNILVGIIIFLGSFIIVLPCISSAHHNNNLEWSCIITLLKIITNILTKHNKTIKTIEEIQKKYYEYLKKPEQLELTIKEIFSKITEIQDCIYNLRKDSPAVPDCIYNFSREKEEKISEERLKNN